MRKHGGTPSWRDKHGTLAAIGPPGVARGSFVEGHQSGLAGCKPPPLFKRGPSWSIFDSIMVLQSFRGGACPPGAFPGLELAARAGENLGGRGMKQARDEPAEQSATPDPPPPRRPPSLPALLLLLLL